MFILKLHFLLNLSILYWYIGTIIDHSDPKEREISVVNLILIFLIGWLLFLKLFMKMVKSKKPRG